MACSIWERDWPFCFIIAHFELDQLNWHHSPIPPKQNPAACLFNCTCVLISLLRTKLENFQEQLSWRTSSPSNLLLGASIKNRVLFSSVEQIVKALLVGHLFMKYLGWTKWQVIACQLGGWTMRWFSYSKPNMNRSRIINLYIKYGKEAIIRGKNVALKFFKGCWK